ncbi:hypothetical protein COCNU_10G009400 [Cocos nucifera]|uniref:RNase H type-1 domain-containing protein n=1 Tax=Cocos nucifera TaxID=13894 RepID=A0A8K0IM68_COCNU|nr:hypothetical protein COCNU_10G009400 [Cocos nucifera]
MPVVGRRNHSSFPSVWYGTGCTGRFGPMSCVLEFDGASKGNPGKSGAGAILRTEDGTVVSRLCEGLGNVTNNVAEYRALILGMKYALKKGFKQIRVQGDSYLVCMQPLLLAAVAARQYRLQQQQLLAAVAGIATGSTNHCLLLMPGSSCSTIGTRWQNSLLTAAARPAPSGQQQLLLQAPPWLQPLLLQAPPVAAVDTNH